jgi:UDP-N-acetylmuramoyl-tripeptide--D-alanyl-D-alanine ligase
VGTLSASTSAAFGPPAQHFHSVAALIAQVRPLLASEVTVLIKGSRFMQMERVVAGLLP